MSPPTRRWERAWIPPHFPTGVVALRLKSLDITGFKSFAQPTRLEFPAAITALVGPNGSGKSNVVDAIRWALGEQSVRDLRGQRSEDIIYAGARRVMGVAEVELIFESGENSSGPAELSIGRRLYRSGESEYRVDGERTLLRDVGRVLRSMGIDQPRHVVVTQGMADALLSCTPGERRSLLEQAAGLAGYRHERDEAESKLAGTRRNIETIIVVLAELEPRLRLLRRQARAVRERNEAAARLAESLRLSLGARWHALASEIRTLEAQVASAASSRGSLKAQVSELEAAAGEYSSRRDAWQREMDGLLRQVRDRERVVAEAARTAERMGAERAALDTALKQVQLEQCHIVTARGEAERRLEPALSHIEALESGCQEEACRAAAVERELAVLRVDLQRLSEDRTTAEDMMLTSSEREREVAGQVEEAGRRLAAERERLERADLTLARLADENLSLRAEEDRLRTRLGVLAGENEHAAQCTRDAAQQLERAVERHERMQRLRRRIHGRQIETRTEAARLASSLRDLERSVAGGVHERLNVSAGWESAVTASLLGWTAEASGATVVHPATFGSWRESLVAGFPAGCGWLDTQVSGHLPPWSPIQSALFARDEDAAVHLWNTLFGRENLPVGVPMLAVYVPSGKRLSSFGWEAVRVDERAAAYLRVKRLEGRAAARAQLWGERASKMDEAAAETTRDLATWRSTLTAARGRQEAGTAECSRVEEALEAVQRRLTRLETESSAERALLETVSTRLPEMLEAEVALRQRLLAVRNELEEHRRAFGEVRNREREIQVRWASLQEHHVALRASVETARAQLEAQRAVAEAVRQDVETRDAEMERFRARERSIRERLAEIERGMAGAEEAHRESLADLETAAARMHAWNEQRPRDPMAAEQLAGLRRRVEQVVSEHERSLAHLAELTDRQRSLRDEIAMELEAVPEALPIGVENPPGADDIRRLRARTLSYPDADESVVREYEESRERDRHLREQLEDLEGAAARLEEIMAASDGEMRVRFESAFAAVSEEFARVFSRMLPGGRGDLVQEREGVEVMAQLPGKRMRPSAAFSGGERALVATSLLFGVLRIRPVPFCILDEVDAALDESNVDRYLGVLREVSERTQTIVVTHNRATMAAADVLYGLTMDDTGTSRVLSLDLRTATQSR